jgi:hypothetical protein
MCPPKPLKHDPEITEELWLAWNIFGPRENSLIVRYLSIIEQNNFAQRGARTHDPEIKSLMLYRLS